MNRGLAVSGWKKAWLGGQGRVCGHRGDGVTGGQGRVCGHRGDGVTGGQGRVCGHRGTE